MIHQDVPNDDLGEWGEAQFRALCASAGLVANKAERDKMGWDFIVELPPEAVSEVVTLDQRPNALSCRIQLKTHWREEKDRVALSLSAAERLAKDPGPSFVLVLTAEASKVDGLPLLVDCHLIHMLDKNLERILKRLRASMVGPKNISLSEQKITFSPDAVGEQLASSGKVIRAALGRICGTDAHDYIARKGEQLKNLGYAAGRYQLQTTIAAANMDEFVEMMLGLRPASIVNLATHDIRFGLPVPVEHFPPSAKIEAKFEPYPVTTCTIRIRGTDLTPPSQFYGEVYMPLVRVPAEHFRVLIKTQFLTIDSGTSGTNLTTHGDMLTIASLSLDDWWHHLRLMELLSETELELNINSNDPNLPPINSQITLRPPRPKEPWVSPLAEAVRRLEALLTMAGAKCHDITILELSEAEDMINIAYARLFDGNLAPTPTFATSRQEFPETALVDLEFLQFDYVVVGDVALAYACRATMRPESAGTELIWRQIDAKPEKLASINKTEDAFKIFVSDVRRQTGLENTMIRDWISVDGG